jgi:hypothetical protein
MLVYIVFLSLIKFVLGEGYYCPYRRLGYDGQNELLYDFYEGNGNYWTRMGRIGWETRESYCRAKGDANLHNDAGEAKCIDSQGTCRWSGSSCEVNPNKQPDCYRLCETIRNGGGLPCLGNCPTGYFSRDRLYSMCQNETISQPSPQISQQTSSPKSPSRKEIIKNPGKRMSCICEEL